MANLQASTSGSVTVTTGSLTAIGANGIVGPSQATANASPATFSVLDRSGCGFYYDSVNSVIRFLNNSQSRIIIGQDAVNISTGGVIKPLGEMVFSNPTVGGDGTNSGYVIYTRSSFGSAGNRVIQWGRANPSFTSNGIVAISFPISFSVTPNVQVSIVDSRVVTFDSIFKIYNLSAAGFNIKFEEVDGNPEVETNYSWIATGYV